MGKFLLENASHIKFCGKHWCNSVFVLTSTFRIMWHYSDNCNIRISIIYRGIKKYIDITYTGINI